MSQWLNIDGFLYRMEEYSRCLSTLFETIISSPSPDTQWYIPIKCFRNLWLGLPLTNTPVYWVFFLLTWWETDYTHCFSFNFRQGQESLRWIWHNWQLIMKNIHIQSLYFFFSFVWLQLHQTRVVHLFAFIPDDRHAYHQTCGEIWWIINIRHYLKQTSQMLPDGMMVLFCHCIS